MTTNCFFRITQNIKKKKSLSNLFSPVSLIEFNTRNKIHICYTLKKSPVVILFQIFIAIVMNIGNNYEIWSVIQYSLKQWVWFFISITTHQWLFGYHEIYLIINHFDFVYNLSSFSYKIYLIKVWNVFMCFFEFTMKIHYRQILRNRCMYVETILI